MGHATITTTGSWTATITGNVTVECAGPGGSGADNHLFSGTYYAGGGGGGAAYAKKVIFVTAGLGYSCHVPAGNGQDFTWFINSSTVAADYGRPGSQAVASLAGSGGAAGLASNSIGDLCFSGVAGVGSDNNGGSGGAAGGAAGNGTGAAGGLSPGSFFPGRAGNAGGIPGAGGSGASGAAGVGSLSEPGGAGARGQIDISWVTVTTIIPGVVNLTITRFAPTLAIIPLARVPGFVSLHVSTLSPSVSITPGLAAPPAQMVITGLGPTLRMKVVVPSRALAISSAAGTAIVSRNPAPFALHFTGYQPNVIIPLPRTLWPRVKN